MIHVSINKALPDARLEIIDQRGLIIYRSDPGRWMNETLTISTSSFERGLYCLRVISGAQSSMIKFIRK